MSSYEAKPGAPAPPDPADERARVQRHEAAYEQAQAQPDGVPRTKSGRRWIFAGVGAVVIAVVGWRVHAATSHAGGPSAAGAGAGAGGGGGAGGPERVVPVATAPVEKRDVPTWLEGLGNATPLYTVVVKTQVDGRLDKVLFKEGEWVKKGTVLAQIDPRPFTIQLHQAQAALVRDTAQLKNGQLNLDRYKTLRGQNLIPQQQLDDQVAAVATNDAAVRADQAQAENARLMLDYARITSPIDGVTGVRLVDPGNIVHPADPNGIVVVTQLDPIAVVFTLPEDDLPRVTKEQAKGKVVVEAWSRDGATKLGSGELAVIDNEVNQQTATIKLKATFPNPDHQLWPNAFVKARLLAATETDAVVVPTAAVQRGPQGTFVYVVGPGNVAQVRPVDVKTTQDALAVIAKGVAPGDVVVTDGQNQIKPGAKIAPEPPPKPAGPR